MFVLAIASALWPALVAVVVVALRSPHPTRLLASFLAGGMLTTVSIGLVIVFTLETSSVVKGPRPDADPPVYFTIGLLALLAGYVVSRRAPRDAGDTGSADDGRRADRPAWSERMLARGAALAFLVGVVLNVIPGLFPFVALKDIAELDYSVWATVALVIGFYVVMFTIVEVPLVAGLVAPEPTAAAVASFNDWLGRHWQRLVVIALEVVGIYLLIRGIVAVAS